VAMAYDFARWRGEPRFVKERLPGVRAVLDIFRRHVDEDGVLHGLQGWNYMDAAFQPGGVPPGGAPGERNAGLQAHWILVLSYAIELEKYAGEPELASRYRRWKREAHQALMQTFWNEERGLLADNDTHSSYSEQAQCLALLAGAFNLKSSTRVWEGLETGTDLVRSTCYFSHYYFEACLAAGRMNLFFKRLELWQEGAREGFRTTPENFGQTRSDCHAWTAHPLYHYLTGVLGIRPGGYGFETVSICPQLGELEEASGELAHPLGPIRIKAWQAGGRLFTEINLPKGLPGIFRSGNEIRTLSPGRQKISTIKLLDK